MSEMNKQVTEEQKELVKIPLWTSIAYGCGAAGGNIMSTLLASFLLSYYTDTAGMAAAAIGTMFIVCRLLDGVTDLLMGGIVDRTNTKLGKCRPWILVSAPLMFLGIVLILHVPDTTQGGKLLYAYLTYIFLNCIVYTILGISHTSILARMTRDSKARNTTSTVSSILNNLSGLVIGSMITVLQLNFGWTITSVILGALSCALILIPGIFCHEVVGMSEMEKKQQAPMKEQLPAVLRNRYFWISLLIGAVTLFVNANAIAAQIYYCNVVLQDPAYMSVLMAVGQAPGVLILFVMPWFVNRYSKRIFMTIGGVLMVIGFALCGMAGMNRALLLTGIIIRAVGIGPMFAGGYAFCADAADYGEWKFGIRSEGMMAASQSIGAKVGIGLGSACTAWILAAVNYVHGQVSDAVVSAIRFDLGWLGAIGSAVLIVLVLFMDVEKYLPEIRRSLGTAKD